MAKSYFKRGDVKPDTGAATVALVRTTDQDWANKRVHQDMPVKELVALLAEHKVKFWHMPVEGGEVICFVGGDASLLAKRALAAIYGS